MSLYEHAQRELDLIEVEEPEKSAILNAVKAFAEGGWSGGSAPWGIATLTRLLQFQPLTPISSDPREWQEVGKEKLAPSERETGVWQNRRRSSTFSRDGGKTWYDIENPELNNGDVWDREAANWVEVQIGNNVKVGSLVRCKPGAYKVGSAQKVNGVPGRVTAIRNGMVAVAHDNEMGFNHHPEVLQVAKT